MEAVGGLQLLTASLQEVTICSKLGLFVFASIASVHQEIPGPEERMICCGREFCVLVVNTRFLLWIKWGAHHQLDTPLPGCSCRPMR